MSKRLMCNLTVMALLSTIVKSGLLKCKTIEQFQEDHGDDVSIQIDFNAFLKREMPAEGVDVGDLKYLGGGGFGRVYEIKMRTRGIGTKVNAALKVIRYQTRHLSEINTELNMLQTLAPQHPLYLLRYYGCVKAETPYTTLFVFTEKLDSDLSARLFKANFRRSPLARRIGIFLNMAYAVKAFHDRNYGHFDIKPGNFGLIFHEEYPIVKLIDYGLAGRCGGRGMAGTKVFMDPEMVENSYEFKLESDIFSLGLTYHELLLGSESVYINNDKYMNRNYVNKSLNLAITRQNEFAQKCTVFAQGLHDVAQNAKNQHNNELLNHISYGSFAKIIQLIYEMTHIEHGDRPTIDQVIEKFETELIKINRFTKYLKTQSKDLIEMIYGTDLEWNNSPPLIEVGINNEPNYPQMTQEDERIDLMFDDSEISENPFKKLQSAQYQSMFMNKAQEAQLRPEDKFVQFDPMADEEQAVQLLAGLNMTNQDFVRNNNYVINEREVNVDEINLDKLII